MNKHLVAALLCLTLILSLLTGCGGSKIQKLDDADAEAAETQAADEPEEADAEAEPTDEPDTNAEATEEPEPTATPVPGLGPEAYDPDTVVATFNGQDVTWREYYYWLSYYVEYTAYLASLGAFTFTGWDGSDIAADKTNADVVRVSAWGSLAQYHAIEDLAEELGGALDQDDLDAIADNFEQSADANGDGDGECTDEEITAFEGYLSEMFMDRALFDRMGAANALYDKSFAALYGEGAADYPDEDVLTYAQDQGMLCCKHILIMSIDQSTGEALSEDDLAERKEKVDGLYDQLAAVADDQDKLVELFDELMAANSEDTGLAMYPDGYLFTPGTMVPEFEGATAALAEYGLSEPVESDYGWHIILRLPIDPDQPVMGSTGSSSTLRANAAGEAFLGRISEVSDGAEVVWKDDFENVDIGEIFGEALS